MPDQSGAKAGYLSELQELERLERELEPSHHQAREEQARAKQLAAERRRALDDIDRQLRGLARAIRLKAKCACLNGAALDRGTLTIGNDALQFAGWHGRMEIALRDIVDIDIGHSSLPARAGLPLIGCYWPGVRRNGEALVITVCDSVSNALAQAVIADMVDAVQWRRQILEGKDHLEDVEAQRGDLATRREQAEAALKDAQAELGGATSALRRVEGQIVELQRQQRDLRKMQRQAEAQGSQSSTKGSGTKGKRGRQ